MQTRRRHTHTHINSHITAIYLNHNSFALIRITAAAARIGTQYSLEALTHILYILSLSQVYQPRVRLFTYRRWCSTRSPAFSTWAPPRAWHSRRKCSSGRCTSSRLALTFILPWPPPTWVPPRSFSFSFCIAHRALGAAVPIGFARIPPALFKKPANARDA